MVDLVSRSSGPTFLPASIIYGGKRVHFIQRVGLLAEMIRAPCNTFDTMDGDLRNHSRISNQTRRLRLQ